jgi:hypothetical protein
MMDEVNQLVTVGVLTSSAPACLHDLHDDNGGVDVPGHRGIPQSHIAPLPPRTEAAARSSMRDAVTLG